jgi:hypothetical protein
VVPIPTTVMVFPLTVAIAGLLLVYVNAPVLLLVGAVIVNGASPKVFGGIEKLVIVGAFDDFQK